MEIYIVRHGIAEDYVAGGDSQRPLTNEGRKKMKEAAEGFARLQKKITHIYSSPLVRAVQTAEILAAALKLRVDTMKELSPGHHPSEIVQKLRQLKNAQSVMLVGHEPNCSQLASYLLSDSGGVELQFKKGSICLLETAQPASGSATLYWLATPQMLRLMAP